MKRSPPKAAFEFQIMSIPLDKLLPARSLAKHFSETAKYQSLLASVREVGIIEPLNVYPQSGGKYLILDGHARKAALDELKIAEVRCLVATEDESYTPNRHVNRISPIQAIRMIVKALDAGLPPERIATSLNLAVQTVRSNRHLLQGICPEAVEIIKDKEVSQDTLALLKKVKAVRQIEMADLMCAAGNYTATYARALVMTTSKDQLVDPESPRKIPGVKPEDLARLEHEMRMQEKDFRLLDETYNEQVMALTIARGYLRPLLDNTRVVRFLAQHFHEFLTEFQRIVEASALES